MKGKVLYFVIIQQFLDFALIAGLYVAQGFQIAEASTTFEDGPEDHVVSVKGKVYDEGGMGVTVELQIVYQREIGGVDSDEVGACFQEVIAVIFGNVDDLFDAIQGPWINDLCDFIFVRYFGVGRRDYFIFLEAFVLVVRLLNPSDVFDDVFGELRPLQMSVSVDVDGLEEFNQV